MSNIIIEPVHEISNHVVCATSKASDQPAHKRSLIRAFASRLSILWLLSYWLNSIWSFKAYKEAAEARLSLHLSKYQIVGNHMHWLILRVFYFIHVLARFDFRFVYSHPERSFRYLAIQPGRSCDIGNQSCDWKKWPLPWNIHLWSYYVCFSLYRIQDAWQPNQIS